MARIRMIKPEFFDDSDLADVSFGARLLFIGLWTLSDKEGRLVEDAKKLKARIFPYDNVEVLTLLDELHGKDMIRRYSTGEKHGFIWIRNFSKHQRPHPKEPASLIPPCANGDGQVPRKETSKPRKETAGTSESGVLSLDPKSGILSTESKNVCAEPVPGSSPPVLLFPTIGVGPKTWALTSDQLGAWHEAYPALDVLQEARKALAWLQANPTRRKTTKGMARCLVGWLSRAVDVRGNGRSQAEPRLHGGVKNYHASWECHHIEPCNNRSTCEIRTAQGRPETSDAHQTA